jgi:hypothetical protein
MPAATFVTRFFAGFFATFLTGAAAATLCAGLLVAGAGCVVRFGFGAGAAARRTTGFLAAGFSTGRHCTSESLTATRTTGGDVSGDRGMVVSRRITWAWPAWAVTRLTTMMDMSVLIRALRCI